MLCEVFTSSFSSYIFLILEICIHVQHAAVVYFAIHIVLCQVESLGKNRFLNADKISSNGFLGTTLLLVWSWSDGLSRSSTHSKDDFSVRYSKFSQAKHTTQKQVQFLLRNNGKNYILIITNYLYMCIHMHAYLHSQSAVAHAWRIWNHVKWPEVVSDWRRLCGTLSLQGNIYYFFKL